MATFALGPNQVPALVQCEGNRKFTYSWCGGVEGVVRELWVEFRMCIILLITFKIYYSLLLGYTAPFLYLTVITFLNLWSFFPSHFILLPFFKNLCPIKCSMSVRPSARLFVNRLLRYVKFHYVLFAFAFESALSFFGDENSKKGTKKLKLK